MKKFVFASVLALASISFVTAPTLRAQDLTIKDPAEYNAYTMATTQVDPKQKAAALESFLTAYPQSIVKKGVIDILIDTYQALGDNDKELTACQRMLQLDPNNLRAIVISVSIKKAVGAHNNDAQTLDDAALLAKKGLTVPKPDATTDPDWKKLTNAAYPVFHSALAVDDIISKKDVKGGIDEYRTELMIYAPDDTTKGPGLVDTLQLAEQYIKPEAKDLVLACWFYARVWNFAPAGFKAQIEKKLDYYYNKYHGGMDGLDDLKAKAAATVFPPGDLAIKPADTPAEKIHKIIATTTDLTTLALADKELVLAYGSKEDADKVWAVMKDQQTPVPGVVTEATGATIKLAVTQDAKDANTPDFIVNMKTALADKDVPAAKLEYGLSSKKQPELDATYDSYTQVPATDKVPQSVQIVLRDGAIVPVKKTAPPAHKPAAGHKPAAH
jgi:hypothetical protein